MTHFFVNKLRKEYYEIEAQLYKTDRDIEFSLFM